ncbi:MAG: succinate dehydrogenase, hydrophobic membrane anchor protein [Gammaproteobacteria bacterium]|nr:succinate dehydrogenase, hydrophobic membrane anchor protein [Gammaproteobacteria bacterium]
MAVVTNAASPGRRGLVDFLVQRVSAVILGLFALCVGGWFAVNPGAGHAELAGYLGTPVMLAFASVAIASLIAHTWIGMWTIGTDYLRPHYFGRVARGVRLAYQVAVVLVLLAYGAWAITVIWRLA